MSNYTKLLYKWQTIITLTHFAPAEGSVNRADFRRIIR
jgi:hypothetical protein